MESFKNITNQPGVWTERIYVVTDDYEICGYVFLPKTGKKNRVLTDLLNSTKKFIAIKDCEITIKATGAKEHHEFIQLNSASIILLRPFKK